jgi:hypothetical protein
MELRQNVFFAGNFIVHFPSESGQYLFKKRHIEVYIFSKILIDTTPSDVHAIISLFFIK